MLRTMKKLIKSVIPAPVLQKYNAIILDHRYRKWAKSRNMKWDIEAVEIETVNRCNGHCAFCPVNVDQPQRKYAKMSDKLFRKIIDELAEMDYQGGISLFSNNEPFLDERIIEFHKYANEKLPRAIFALDTNGTVLTLEKFIEILPFLDRFVIDNYNDDGQINTPELQKIYDYIQAHKEIQNRVDFLFRRENEILFSRGGQAPNKTDSQDKSIMNVLCTHPFRQLIIRPTGEISLCCNDALGKYTMGDLNVQTIREVWESGKYKSFRAEMLKNGRKNLLLCNQCDSIFEPEFWAKRKRPLP
ncbi:MAG: SPASM domain-containing protein [Synergistaceae bacterium]|nr:SPASM domain-containing protein [Synergistaceae bacterium]